MDATHWWLGNFSEPRPYTKAAEATNYAALMNGHGRVVCEKCDTTLASCRCKWTDDHKEVKTVCDECRTKEAREFVPGEDCAGCGASMEKNENGYCNSCGRDYDTGTVPDLGLYHEGIKEKEAELDQGYLLELLLKEAASTHTYTANGNTYDVLKLIEILKDRPTQLAALDALKVNRSRRTGYSPRRMAAANTTFPGIVDETGDLVDGRHRAAKMIEHGQTHMPVRTATPADLEAAKVG